MEKGLDVTYCLVPKEESNRRLKEAALYIASRCQDDPRFGLTKLNKILYFSDFIHYAKTGEAITGGEYMKLPQGPAPHQMKPVLRELFENNDMVIQERDYFGKVQKKPIPLREANLGIFSAEIVARIDSIIEVLSDHNASQVSVLSHDRAWRIAKLSDRIPYEAVFISDEHVTPYDVERAETLNAKLNWNSVN